MGRIQPAVCSACGWNLSDDPGGCTCAPFFPRGASTASAFIQQPASPAGGPEGEGPAVINIRLPAYFITVCFKTGICVGDYRQSPKGESDVVFAYACVCICLSAKYLTNY